MSLSASTSVPRKTLFRALSAFVTAGFQTNPAQTKDYLSLILGVELGKGVTIAQLMTSGLAVIAKRLSYL